VSVRPERMDAHVGLPRAGGLHGLDGRLKEQTGDMSVREGFALLELRKLRSIEDNSHMDIQDLNGAPGELDIWSWENMGERCLFSIVLD